MDSYQPFSPSFKSSLMAETDKPSGPESVKPNPGNPTGEFIGSLDVFIHEARDIHNICIYHKQDVYAKISLTTDPESAVSTQIINGGGRNPVFNQSLRFNIKTIESSVKCEVWMLSRVRNYLEDQLLGFSLVPLSDVVMSGGKLVDEFSLSSTDLFHSPAGFIKLSLEYTGSSPDVMAIAASPKPAIFTEKEECELNKIEFPDLNIANENKMMVSEYFGIPCDNLDNQNTDCLISPEEENCLDDEAGVRVVESFATASSPDSSEVSKNDTHDSSEVLKNGTPVSSSSTSAALTPKDKSTEEETDSSSLGTTDNAFPPPLININIETGNSVVQQDIVDMYMKSMQQFTESLANMKLPMDIENSNSNGSSSSSNVSTPNCDSGADQKLQEPKKTGSRVFYGSRAFF